MRSRSGKMFVTLLMFIPLVSIPLMAVFGIPEFSLVERVDPLSFSADSKSMTSSNLGQPGELASDITENGSFDTNTFANRETTPVNNLQGVDPFQIREKKTAHTGLQGWALAKQQNASSANHNMKLTGYQRERSLSEDSNSQSVSDLDSIIDRRTRTGSSNAANQMAPFPGSGKNNRSLNADDHLSRWRGAISKLQNIGIKDYTLKPGSSPNLFHFSCVIPQNPNAKQAILHRFEAEAEDPIQAIANVIEQIKEWSQQNP